MVFTLLMSCCKKYSLSWDPAVNGSTAFNCMNEEFFKNCEYSPRSHWDSFAWKNWSISFLRTYWAVWAVNYFGKKLHLRLDWGCASVQTCTDISFIITRISERPDIQGKWFNTSINVHEVGFVTDGPHIKSDF